VIRVRTYERRRRGGKNYAHETENNNENTVDVVNGWELRHFTTAPGQRRNGVSFSLAVRFDTSVLFFFALPTEKWTNLRNSSLTISYRDYWKVRSIVIVINERGPRLGGFFFATAAELCVRRRDLNAYVSIVRGATPGKIVQLPEGEIRWLCLKSRKIFLSQSSLLELETPIKICGELLLLFFFLC